MNKDSPFRPLPGPLERLRRAVRAYRLAKLSILRRYRMTHGIDVTFARGADIRAPQFVELGDRVSVGKNFTCETDLRVGSDVLISSNVSIVGKDHAFDDPNLTIYTGARSEDSLVEIGSDVLIGFGSILVGPVSVGDGCIVGAGAVVTKDLPENFICAGVPARPIRPRFQEGPGHTR